ncbi:MAG: Trk system potassium transporter TrkA [Gammaproteobacteria bacterium]|nr:Trk system potassium transporter TrkA [Gammaproteobacteria bacterium]
MNIVILGAGAVGGTLADTLNDHLHRITVVDENVSQLERLQKLDGVLTVSGNAAEPHVLEQANVDEADMVIAVTGRDEINIVASQVARSVYETPKVIIRLRSQDYARIERYKSRYLDNLVVINPENEVRAQVERLLEYPRTFEVAALADNKVAFVGFRALRDMPPCGMTVDAMLNWNPTRRARFVAAFRKFVPLDRGSEIQRKDEIYFCAPTAEVPEILNECLGAVKPERKVLIAGAGRIGTSLAKVLQVDHSVRIIEPDLEHARVAADQLRDGIVYPGDATDAIKQRECEIADTDLFVAVTNDDEINVMSCLLAKQEGARQTIALLNQDPYVRLLNETNIDVALSPQRATSSSVLSLVHENNIRAAHRLRVGTCEVFETVVRGSAGENRVTGKKVNKVGLPQNASILAVVRDAKVIEVDDNTVLQEGDIVVIYVAEAAVIQKVLRLFQLSAFSFN